MSQNEKFNRPWLCVEAKAAHISSTENVSRDSDPLGQIDTKYRQAEGFTA